MACGRWRDGAAFGLIVKVSAASASEVNRTRAEAIDATSDGDGHPLVVLSFAICRWDEGA